MREGGSEGGRDRGIEGGRGRRVKHVGVYISYRLLMEKLHRLLELRHMELLLLMYIEKFLPQ